MKAASAENKVFGSLHVLKTHGSQLAYILPSSRRARTGPCFYAKVIAYNGLHKAEPIKYLPYIDGIAEDSQVSPLPVTTTEGLGSIKGNLSHGKPSAHQRSLRIQSCIPDLADD